MSSLHLIVIHITSTIPILFSMWKMKNRGIHFCISVTHFEADERNKKKKRKRKMNKEEQRSVRRVRAQIDQLTQQT